jgi:hypothetical protein
MEIPEANEKLQPVRDQFLVRFYRWAKEDSSREFREDFALLRRIDTEITTRFVEFAEKLNERERAVFSGAMVKRFHPRAVELLNDPASVQEASLIRLFSDWKGMQDWSAGRRQQLANKLSFRKLLLQKLIPVLGEPAEIRSNRESWIHQQEIGCWLVRTWIDTGGRRGLQYSHSISAGEFVPLLANASFLSWLGISTTEWPLIEEGKEESTANCLLDLCSHFMRAAQTLLEGLIHDLPELRVRSWKERVTVKKHRKDGTTIVTLSSSAFQSTLAGRASWEIPTSIIPEQLRAIGSQFYLVQDPDFTQPPGNPLTGGAVYKHLRIEAYE